MDSDLAVEAGLERGGAAGHLLRALADVEVDGAVLDVARPRLDGGDGALERAFLALLPPERLPRLSLAARLLVRVVGVVAAEDLGRAGVDVDFEDLLGALVEERAVVGDDDNRPRKAADEVLDPFDADEVEVVRGLVEQQRIRPLRDHVDESELRELAAGELGDERLRLDFAQAQSGAESFDVDRRRLGDPL